MADLTGVKGSLRKKLIVALIAITLLPGVFGVSATYLTSKYMFLSSVGRNFSEMAIQKSETIESLLVLEIQRMQSLSQGPDVLNAVNGSIEMHQNMSDEEMAQYTELLDKKLSTGKMSDPIVREITESNLAKRLASIRQPDPKKYISVCVWDKNGYVVACVKPKSFSASKSDWFKKTLHSKEGTAYISDIHKNSAGKYIIEVSVPIYDKTVKGVIKAAYDPSYFFKSVVGSTFGDTGHFNLLDSDGNLLLDAIYKPYQLKFPVSLMSKITNSKEGYIVGTDEHDKQAIIGVSLLGNIPGVHQDSFGGKRWYISVRQLAAEVVSPTFFIVTSAIIPGIFTVIILLLIAATAISRLINPLERLKKGAQMIGRGNFDYRLNLSTGDEIEELGTAFNLMAQNLKSSEDKLQAQTDKLRAINEQLETANKLKSEFLASMSHELRTPLNSIIGFSEVLIDKIFGDLSEKQNKYVSNIRTSGKHLLALINDILDLSKVEAGKMDLNIDKFSVANALTDVETIIWPLASKKQLKLSIQKNFDLPEIAADLGKFKQVMYNLLSNAVKFTPENGSITVKTSIKDGFIETSVEDTGIGIKEEDIGLIFEEFRQADVSLSRQFEGTGLGLALTRKLVELHGGRIWAKSQIGKGSTFTFILPLEGSIEETSQLEQKFPSPTMTLQRTAVDINDNTVLPVSSHSQVETVSFVQQTETKKVTTPVILVVEDDLKSSELMQIYLTQAGYEVDYAYDGLQAVEKAEQIKPMIILLDIMLPKLDGWAVLQELRSREATADIPVIIVSMVDNSELGFALGAIDYLMKPIDKENLLAHLKKHSFVAKAKDSPFTILVVDDDPNSVELVTAILEPEGFGILKAFGGEEAINVAKNALPDLMVLDLMMPSVNGFDVINTLKKDIRAKNIPIIVFTAKELSIDDVKQLNTHILKTIKKGELSKEDLLEEIYKIEQLKPHHAHLIDELTGLFNRRYFLKRLSREISDSEISKRTFAILMADIDNFDKFNNLFGKEAGDKALIEIAHLLKSNIRKDDLAIRLESDNFAIVLPQTTREAATRVSEKLLRNVQMLYYNEGNDYKLTISIGISNYFVDANDQDHLIEKAIENLRAAIVSGGNKIFPERVLPE